MVMFKTFQWGGINGLIYFEVVLGFDSRKAAAAGLRSIVCMGDADDKSFC